MDCNYSWTVRLPLNRVGTFSSDEEIICGFKFWLTCRTKQAAIGSMCELKLCYACCEGSENYRLLIDYRLMPKNENCSSSLSVGDNHYSVKYTPSAVPSLHVQFEMIDNATCTGENPATKGDNRKEQCLTLSRDNLLKLCGKTAENSVCFIEIVVKVRDMLIKTEQNYGEESDTRNFRLMISGRTFYVNLVYLAELDSDYFRNLVNRTRNEGISQHIIDDVNINPGDFANFLEALCTYRKPVIVARNFDSVLNVASALFINKALRACESFLSQCQSVHPIRKLEFSVNHGFGLLGDSIVKKLCDDKSVEFGHLCALHEYMSMNNECLYDQNLDVLEALNIYEDFLVV